MRVPATSEIVLLARVLTRVAPQDRPGLARSILADADEAERCLTLTGRMHRTFGDGSLMARCHTLCPPPEPLGDDPAFLQCLALAAQAMLAHSKG